MTFAANSVGKQTSKISCDVQDGVNFKHVVFSPCAHEHALSF
jgi:hypothetical protein